MKHKTILLRCLQVFSVLMSFCGVVLIFSIAFPKKYPTAALISGICAGVLLIVNVVIGTCYYKTSGARKKEWKRFLKLPKEEVKDFKTELEKMRENYHSDPNPEKNKIEDVNYFSQFSRRFVNFSSLKNGQVYYAYLVECRDGMFKNGLFGNVYPATIIYGADECFEKNPYALKKIAEYMLANKSQNVLGNGNDFISQFRLLNPATEGYAVFMTTVFLYRPHLPCGHMCGKVFPVIAEPDKLNAVFVLDSKYWTDDIIANFVHKDISDPNK